jgi:hypothetical protein
VFRVSGPLRKHRSCFNEDNANASIHGKPGKPLSRPEVNLHRTSDLIFVTTTHCMVCRNAETVAQMRFMLGLIAIVAVWSGPESTGCIDCLW